ncbi:hypothetical protein FNF28_01191 [Cafeteria roenbergensis]|uniref:Uncharacterized protein n=1 Tax=Cafeteria roenbergensis TaxID=33653 RepID=A0A5A8E0N4_CAFRO|nr:hypothetical protein FNF28_01191 [Cafeteria roenbergensis]
MASNHVRWLDEAKGIPLVGRPGAGEGDAEHRAGTVDPATSVLRAARMHLLRKLAQFTLHSNEGWSFTPEEVEEAKAAALDIATLIDEIDSPADVGGPSSASTPPSASTVVAEDFSEEPGAMGPGWASPDAAESKRVSVGTAATTASAAAAAAAAHDKTDMGPDGGADDTLDAEEPTSVHGSMASLRQVARRIDFASVPSHPAPPRAAGAGQTAAPPSPPSRPTGSVALHTAAVGITRRNNNPRTA